MTWADLVRGQAHLSSSYDPLLQFIFKCIPEDMREVPDFRIPVSLQKQWRSPKYHEMRHLLHVWRLDHDEEYRISFQTKDARKNQRMAKEGWYSTARDAMKLRDDLSDQGNVPSEVLLVLSGAINVLWDQHAKPSDKQRALEKFAEVRGVYEKRHPTETKAAKLRKFRSVDLIRQAQEAAAEETDAKEE